MQFSDACSPEQRITSGPDARCVGVAETVARRAAAKAAGWNFILNGW